MKTGLFPELWVGIKERISISNPKQLLVNTGNFSGLFDILLNI